jgi:serine/threonine-protein kinase
VRKTQPGSFDESPEENQGLTLEGQILGTPAYMPPEQARGLVSEIDHRSDIYSLGAILYEIVTWSPPFEGRTPRDTISMVLSGPPPPPSARVASLRNHATRSVPPPKALPDPVSVEIDEICLRAMRPCREERYATAHEMADDIQAFLEGQKERERNLEQAHEKVTEGRVIAARLQEMRAELLSREAELENASTEVRSHWPPEKKVPFWRLEEATQRLRKELLHAFGHASTAFHKALGFDRENADARAALADLAWDQFRHEEAQGRQDQMILMEDMVRDYNDGHYDEMLRGDGTLTLVVEAFPCDCLLPASPPAPMLCLKTLDLVTAPFGSKDFIEENKRRVPPADRTEAGARFGHGPGCRRESIGGAAATVFCYEEEERRLVLRGPVWEGPAPMDGIPMAMGSYLVRVTHPGYAPVSLPVLVKRGERVSARVTLYREEELPPRMKVVPAGVFLAGGPEANRGPLKAHILPYDFFVAVHSVTCAEYLAFLDDLAARDPEEAARCVPRNAPTAEFCCPWTGEGYAIPTSSWLAQAQGPAREKARRLAHVNADWDEDWPISSISWFDAMAFCQWESARQGRIMTLPTEEEWEKAARGADGRVYPFGNIFETAHGNFFGTFEAGMRPSRTDEIPTDESPYGIRGMGGNIRDWCLNDAGSEQVDWRAMRGGAFGSTDYNSCTGSMWGTTPDFVHMFNGFRMALRAESLPGKYP